MPVILKLDTKPSLFEPLEIEVDGVTFRVREVTLEDLERIQNLRADLRSGSAAAIRKTIESLIEGDISPVMKLPLKKLRTLIETLIERTLSGEGDEKNGPGPGDESLPS